MKKAPLKNKTISPLVRKQIIQAQRNEVTEYHIYKRLARKAKSEKTKAILNRIADDELRHYKIWMKYTGREVEPSSFNMFKFFWISVIFGLSFGLKQMEKGEERAQINYTEIGKEIPEALIISNEENEHEKEILKLIKNRNK